MPAAPTVLRTLLALPNSAKALFATRSLRLFAYGSLGVLLVLYLKALGLRDDDIGYFLTITLLGDSLVSLFVTGNADSMGRKGMLCFGAVMMAITGICFAVYPTFTVFDEWFGHDGDHIPDPGFDLEGWKGWVFYLGLVVIGTVGVISPSGNEVGPFVALETSILAKFVRFESRATVFAWYALIGSFSTALGSLFAGLIVSHLTESSVFASYYTASSIFQTPTAFLASPKRKAIVNSTLTEETTRDVDAAELLTKIAAYRIVVAIYGIVGVALTVLFWRLSSDVEQQAVATSIPSVLPCVVQSPTVDDESAPLLPTPSAISFSANSRDNCWWKALFKRILPGLNFPRETRWTVIRLSLLFTLDSFGTSIMTGSMLAYWFSYKYGVDEAYLGEVLFVSNILAGISSLIAGHVSGRIGLVKTMVFTHLPANILMLSVPFMPNLFWATTVLFIRATISQMDVGPRQAYISSIVPSNDRTAVLGIINTLRSLGAAFGPLVTGYLAEKGLFDYAFVACGGLTILYDLLLLWSFGDSRSVPLRMDS
ncbi:major facilitator superfamily domain-containing protein [Obelidium mucronatum]|nr:major facilitator superfamily domain-containing protein [Obelidium mucronatum]